jgi:hypothetical protein
MSGYISSPWLPSDNNGDPIERCHASTPNYHPLNRFSPHVDANFSKPAYHTQAMPYYHATGVSGYVPPMPPMVRNPVMKGYSKWTFPIFDIFNWEK